MAAFTPLTLLSPGVLAYFFSSFRSARSGSRAPRLIGLAALLAVERFA